MTTDLLNLFRLENKTAMITGGGGVLCSVMSKALASMGVRIAVLDLNEEVARTVADEIVASGGKAIAIKCDVLNKQSVQEAFERAVQVFHGVDFLINGAGGNKAQATTSPDKTFFDLPADAVQFVFNLNFLGTFIPSQVVGKAMAEKGEGVIINISSMNSFRPLTRIPAYSAAKASVSNFTQWLAVHMAQEYSPKIRVNALAPGFFLTEQNRFLLTDAASGELTARGKTIIQHTPAGRFGAPEDLLGTLIWLLSPAAEFVTGIVVPVDGGFSAFSGV